MAVHSLRRLIRKNGQRVHRNLLAEPLGLTFPIGSCVLSHFLHFFFVLSGKNEADGSRALVRIQKKEIRNIPSL